MLECFVTIVSTVGGHDSRCWQCVGLSKLSSKLNKRVTLIVGVMNS